MGLAILVQVVLQNLEALRALAVMSLQNFTTMVNLCLNP